MTELKPCPFCGHDPIVNNDGGYTTIECRNRYCPAYVEIASDCEQKAIEAWNTRAERTCKPEIEHHGDLILTRYPCCGYELKEYRYSPYPEEAFNNCPNCGARVVWD